MLTASQHQRPRFLTRALVIFVLLTCLRVWLWPASVLPGAQAQIPDSGLQRKLLLEEVQQTNRLLGEVREILRSHTFNVRIEGADNQAHPPAARRQSSE